MEVIKLKLKLNILEKPILVWKALKPKLMLPIHESKTTGHKFNGRKGVGDEVLELPIGIMQDNTQVVGWQREV